MMQSGTYTAVWIFLFCGFHPHVCNHNVTNQRFKILDWSYYDNLPRGSVWGCRRISQETWGAQSLYSLRLRPFWKHSLNTCTCGFLNCLFKIKHRYRRHIFCFPWGMWGHSCLALSRQLSLPFSALPPSPHFCPLPSGAFMGKPAYSITVSPLPPGEQGWCSHLPAWLWMGCFRALNPGCPFSDIYWLSIYLRWLASPTQWTWTWTNSRR